MVHASENLYRAYLFFGDPLFKEFADTWLYHDYWRPFAETAAPRQVLPVHAYSHVNSFSSAAAAYLVTGDERYRQICTNAYDFMLNTQCYATGGYGPDERLMPPDGSLGARSTLSAITPRFRAVRGPPSSSACTSCASPERRASGT